MSGALTVSVVIVSRGRPDALRRCLLGVSQLRYDPFEVVVVADAAGRAALPGVPAAAHVKLIAFDAANISAARNAGIAAAAGAIVAFIDDDSVPEPTWLLHLVAGFRDPAVVAAGGFVRGRNGISFQSRGAMVNAAGRETPLPLDPARITLLRAAPGHAIKTEGTNMAFRRSTLAALGGFDPCYRFFLDETDLNLRLAERGAVTALAPLAQVHHGFDASATRRADRAPRDLSEIGASWAVFLGRHCAKARRAQVWADIQASERRRALRHMVAGRLEPRDVRRLMAGLHAGYADGLARASKPLSPLPDPTAPFLPFPQRPQARSVLLTGRPWSRQRLRTAARTERAAGNRVTVFRFSPSALFHRVAFTDEGIWEQTGGLWGKSDRSQPLIRLWSFAGRIRAEAKRVSRLRGFDAAT
ncbi:glycosyltransferase family 2 protein [Antarcticimicrobium sediminis]|uniref:Glycosyltransferase family 2 protein n=1 Tax=Antarcticimicrobium sediminis TaxID=2546227 RepID=A0A4V2Z7M9_9RHOB|nr:glycosyltransferase family 2 protein [Antarcticimicrobium sediminis]TDE37066.1 glycosyltransferase family 2 protein [Antarcticimicrobium sediminis]